MITIHFLGTSAAIPTRDRNFPAILLKYNEDRILFDCGEGTQRQLMIKNLKLMRIRAIFITHWHADHFAGLLGLIHTMTGLVQTRMMEWGKKPLYIYGPEGTAEFVEKLLSIGYFEREFPVIAEDLKPGDRVEFKDYYVEAFKTYHGIPSLGYIFQERDKLKANMEKAKKFGLTSGPLIGKLKKGEEIVYRGQRIKPDDILEVVKGRKIVYTGDTGYDRSLLLKPCKDADVLICDSTFCSDFEDKAHTYRHMTSRQAATLAKEANAKLLVLTHISGRYQKKGDDKNRKYTTEKLLREAKEIFPNTVLAEDFMELDIK